MKKEKKKKKKTRNTKNHKSNMKKSMKGEVVLTARQIQATRLNQLEYRRLQVNINSMEDDLKIHLARLHRQAQGIRYHYANVVRIVKPNPVYQLSKQGQTDSKNWLESRKLIQRSQSNTRQQIPSSNEVSSESIRPLLVLLDNQVKKPVETIINLNENFLRPTTSPVKKHLADQKRTNPLLTKFTEHSIQSQKSASSTSSFLPSIKSSSSRKFEPVKLIPSTTTTQTTSNHNTLYRIAALPNQTAYKSVEKRKLLDKKFPTQHQALKATIRSTGLVN